MNINRQPRQSGSNSQYARKKQEWLQMLGGKCVECGYDESPKALTFAKVDPLDSLPSLPQLIAISANKLIRENLHKFRVLCANCTVL